MSSERAVRELGLRLTFKFGAPALYVGGKHRVSQRRREIGNGENGANLVVGYEQGHRGKLKAESEINNAVRAQETYDRT
jgi:hypothetical protein